MFLTCEECATSYEVPLQTAPENKKVRCSVCTHIWVAKPEDWSQALENGPIEALEGEEAPDRMASDERFSSEEIVQIDPTEMELPDELDFSEVADPLPDEEPIVEQSDEDEVEEEENSQDDIDSLFDSPVSDDAPQDIEEEEGANQDEIDELLAPPPPKEDVKEAPPEDQAPIPEKAEIKEDLEALESLFGVGEEPEPTPPEKSTPQKSKTKTPKKAKHKPHASTLLPSFVTPDVAGWSTYGLGMILAIYIGYSARFSIVKTIPATASLYASLGIDVNVRGIDFQDIAYKKATKNGSGHLIVTGVLKNLTGDYKTIPAIKVAGVNKDRKEVYQWVSTMPDTPIYPHKTYKFTLNVPAPPPTTKALKIHFAN